MTDAANSANQSVWRWLIQRIRVSGVPLVVAGVLWWVAFTAHPSGHLPMWLYRTTLVASASLASLQAAYTLRFGKRLD